MRAIRVAALATVSALVAQAQAPDASAAPPPAATAGGAAANPAGSPASSASPPAAQPMPAPPPAAPPPAAPPPATTTAPASPAPPPAASAPPAATAAAVRDPVATPEERAIVLRAIPAPQPECPACSPPEPAAPETERALTALVRELDGLVVEALEDLGLRVDPTGREEATDAVPSDAELVERARNSWVFSPRVSFGRGRAIVRMVAVAPGSTVVFSRTERMRPEELEVNTVLMMRDLVRAGSRRSVQPVSTPRADEDSVVHAARSRGRAVLALNTAVLGGYVGFSLQRAGGSDDARLTYPLIALGAGIGLGGSMIVADEWDVGTGDAWYLSAGMWWPTLGTLLVFDDEPEKNRYLYGTAAAAGGLGLATLSVAFGSMSEGDALVAHSGGAYGLFLGGILDLAVQGKTDATPATGMGIGTISGVLITGTVARLTEAQAPSRILLIDLSAGLGALTGAALASPLVFGDEVTSTQNRLWLSSIALGTFVGAGVGLLTTPNQPEPRGQRASLPCTPYVGVVGQSTAADGSAVPVPGGGVRGVW